MAGESQLFSAKRVLDQCVGFAIFLSFVSFFTSARDSRSYFIPNDMFFPHFPVPSDSGVAELRGRLGDPIFTNPNFIIPEALSVVFSVLSDLNLCRPSLRHNVVQTRWRP
jgi:hypothetical protein